MGNEPTVVEVAICASLEIAGRGCGEAHREFQSPTTLMVAQDDGDANSLKHSTELSKDKEFLMLLSMTRPLLQYPT